MTASRGARRSDSTVTSTKLMPWETALCGASAGLISRFVIAPLDVVKIRLQLQTQRPEPFIPSLSNRLHIAKHGVVSAMDGTHVKYTGMLQGIKTIAREEGLTGLWKGNLSAEYLYLTYGASQFFAYQHIESYMADLDTKNRLPQTFRAVLSGAMAGSVATALTYPFDLLRTKFAVQGEERMYKGIIHAFRSIYVEEGVRGFYRGVVPSIVQIMPYMGLMFGSYDTFKRGIGWLKERNHFPVTGSSVEDILCGGLASIFSKTGVFPMDVVRKRLQVQGPHRKDCVIANVPKYSGSMLLCMHQIIRHEGFRALYKGLVPGIVKAAPAGAVTFLVYGKTREMLEWWKEGRKKKMEGVMREERGGMVRRVVREELKG